MELIPVITEEWKMDAGACFGVIPKALWSKVYPEGDDNLLKICNRLLIVKTENRVILIDTGYGDKQSEKYYHYKYIGERKEITEALKEKGIPANEVTDVLLTHLHDDHLGIRLSRFFQTHITGLARRSGTGRTTRTSVSGQLIFLLTTKCWKRAEG